MGGGSWNGSGKDREPNGPITSLTPHVRGIYIDVDDDRQEDEETQEVQEEGEDAEEDWAKIAKKRAPTTRTVPGLIAGTWRESWKFHKSNQNNLRKRWANCFSYTLPRWILKHICMYKAEERARRGLIIGTKKRVKVSRGSW